MRVTEISVKGLFGVFDHVIPLNLEDRITIIHGPNGVGKTVLLKMVDAFFNGHYTKFQKAPFEKFSVAFDDASVISLSCTPNLQIIFSKPGLEQQIFVPDQESSVPTWLAKLSSISVKLIESQRLLAFAPTDQNNSLFSSNTRFPSRVKILEMISKYSDELLEQIQSKLAESAEVSQSLERTFPVRLVQKAFSPMPETELRSSLSQLEQKQAWLSSVGLLTNGNGNDFQSTPTIDEQNINALSIYVQDAQKKLGVFDNLATKLDLFKKIVNRKFLYKRLSISKEQGLLFSTPNGQIIPLNSLSSGEQHELVLLYELLFNTKPDSLILIDEPEISLHLAWQVNFLRDLQEICRLAKLDIILATHSPEIIHDRWDLTVGLKGPTQ